MLRTDGIPVAEAYATAMARDSPYTVSHNVNMVNVVGETGVLHLYLMDEHHIHCRVQGEPFPEQDLVDLCGAISHLPYSALASTAMLSQNTWLGQHPEYQRRASRTKAQSRRTYVSDRQ